MPSTTDDNGGDKRRHPRYRVAKRVRATTGELEHEGVLLNISGSGAAIEPGAEVERGDEVELDIEDIGALPGRVVRSVEDDLFAVEFDIDEEDEARLLSELTQRHGAHLAEEM
jgi:hypothetical protein